MNTFELWYAWVIKHSYFVLILPFGVILLPNNAYVDDEIDVVIISK